MLICGNCKAENDNGCLFCYQCGCEMSKGGSLRVPDESKKENLSIFKYNPWWILICLCLIIFILYFVAYDIHDRLEWIQNFLLMRR